MSAWLSFIGSASTRDATEDQIKLSERPVREIGEGQASRVYEYQLDGERVAVKRFKKNEVISENAIIKEATFLSNIEHCNIVKFIGSAISKRSLVFELCEINVNNLKLNTLRSYLNIMQQVPKGEQPIQPRLSCISGIVSGLKYLHENDIVHSDIKATNILVNGDLEHPICKLADFGESIKLKGHLTMTQTISKVFKGTSPYMAPELIPPCERPVATRQSDIYALSMTLFEVVQPDAIYPWSIEFPAPCDPSVIYSAVRSGKRPNIFNLSSFYPPGSLKDLNKIKTVISKAWDQEPSLRPNIKAIETLLEIQSSHAQPNISFELFEDEIQEFTSTDIMANVKPVQHKFVKPLLSSTPISEPIDTYTPSFDIIESIAPEARRVSTAEIDNHTRSESQEVDNHPSTTLRADDDIDDAICEILQQLKIKSLHGFQWKAIKKIISGHSVLLSNKCGSGKSLCFIIPALYNHRTKNLMTLVIEPSVALLLEQVENLKRLGIDAIFLGASNDSKEKAENQNRVLYGDPPVIVYCTPEYMFGEYYRINTYKDRFQSILGLWVVDEVHKVVDRTSEFRSCYEELSTLQVQVNVPVFYCSATIPRLWLAKLENDFLAVDHVKMLHPVRRDNVSIHLRPYNKSRNKELVTGKACDFSNAASSSKCDSTPWNNIIETLKEIMQENITVCFVDFRRDAEFLAGSLQDAGLKARFLVGAGMSTCHKRIAAAAFKSGEDTILVATETYECGMNNKECNCVIRIGCPRNMSVIVQELGRTGRGDKDGQFHLLWNEFHDDCRLAHWVNLVGNTTDEGLFGEEKMQIVNDYILCWRFIYSPYIGMCTNEALLAFYDDPTEQPIEIKMCQKETCHCDVCRKTFEVVNVSPHLISILETLRDANQLSQDLTMHQLARFLLGSSEKFFFERPNLISLPHYGCATKWDEEITEEGINNIIRIGICLNVIQMYFKIIKIGPTGMRAYRYLSITTHGENLIESNVEIMVPNPLSHIDSSSASRNTNRKKRRSAANTSLPVVKNLLKNPKDWERIEDEQQYRLLGFDENVPIPFLYYIPDWKKIRGAGDSPDFIRNDLQLSKGSGQSKKKCTHTIEIDGKQTTVEIRINSCQGCKKCPDQECKNAFTNYAKFNTCRDHKHLHKELDLCGSDCPISFVYVYPNDESDTRQWCGCVTDNPKNSQHNHPAPIDWKLKSKTKKDLRSAKELNPNIKPRELQKGVNMPYEPMKCDPVATHVDKLRNATKDIRPRGHYSTKYASLEIMENFSKIKKKIDTKTSEDMANEDITSAVDDLIGDYAIKDHTVMVGAHIYAFFAANWQLQLFAQATHIFVDVTYIKTHDFPGLLNIVAPCTAIKGYLSVFRVFISKQDSTSFAYAINRMLDTVTESFPGFERGKNLEQIMVDFSDAEDNGIKEVLGPYLADKIIRGCKFHFLQSAQKVAILVTKTQNEELIFIHLAKKIPDCDSKDHVKLVFQVLAGTTKPAVAINLITEEDLVDPAMLIDNTHWKTASHWVNWWLRESHLKKLAPAYSEIPRNIWDSSPATNNPCESNNKVSKPATLCTVDQALQHVYYEDRRSAFLLHAINSGLPITYRRERLQKKRKRTNNMGDPLNPPDSKKRLKKKKIPRGKSAVNHHVRINYFEDDSEASTKWYNGKIIGYDRSKGYLIRFDGCGPEEDTWEKNIMGDSFELRD